MDSTGLSPSQWDRATGAIIGLAVGNALGSGFAFEPRSDPSHVRMRPGGLGPYELGEWADDTAMALPVLEVLASGKDLLGPDALDDVAARWARWFETAKDTAPIINAALRAYDRARGAASMQEAAARSHAAAPSRPAGNASIMRTTTVMLGFLHKPSDLARAARAVSDLTHGNPRAGDACVLLNLAQRHAVLTGQFDLSSGLEYLPDQRQDEWDASITRAEIGEPEAFALRNGLAEQVLQTVWSAITGVPAEGPQHFEQTLRVVVAAGGDTPSSGAVAGGLLGARWGVSAIPLQWRRHLHGWPGLRDVDLVRLVWEVLSQRSWPRAIEQDDLSAPAVQHPLDAGVWLGGLTGLRPLPGQVDAVVSLCHLGHEQLPLPRPADENHLTAWLVDSPDPRDNPNLELHTGHVVDMIERLREQGRTVYVHCDDGASRTALVAALYGARVSGLSPAGALLRVQEVMPHARPNPAFMEVLDRRG